tara:strand:+ start:76 stop:1176 length:1101 start_codon:yes stop_codon:yes gene_type:complete
MLDMAKYGFKFLNIETLGNCNMNCKFCNWDSRQNKESVMCEEAVYRLIDEATHESSGCQSINFCQFNEPLLDKRLFEFIAYTKERGMTVFLTSNGLLLGKKRILEGMLASGPDNLTLSVQTLSENKFGHARGINMDFPRYTATIYKFLSAIKDTDMQVTMDMACNFLTPAKKITRQILGFNVGDPNAPLTLNEVYPDLENFLKGLQVYDASFVFDSSGLKEYFEELNSDYREQSSFSIASNIEIKIKRFMYGQRLQEFEPTMGKFECHHPILGVLASGHVVPCCHMSSPYATLGSTLNKSLEDVLESGSKMIDNIRSVDGAKPLVCKRCFGERTKRAVKLVELRKKFDFDIGFHPLHHTKRGKNSS